MYNSLTTRVGLVCHGADLNGFWRSQGISSELRWKESSSKTLSSIYITELPMPGTKSRCLAPNLFLWDGMFRDNRFAKEQIDESRGLATSLHERRLFYLYTDPNNPTNPGDRIEKGEAENLVKLVRARLELEKATHIADKFEQEDIDNLKWFFKATEDPDKRKVIFGGPSIKKLEEVQNGKEWISWLRGVFQKNEEEIHALAEKEIRRQETSEKEQFEPKYKMRVRIQSQSKVRRVRQS